MPGNPTATTGSATAATAKLTPAGFACIVIGNIRRRDGSLIDLGGLTTTIMQEAGLQLYNDAILVTAVGSLALRAARIFTGGRKLARTHQQVLIYCLKGANAKEALGALPPDAVELDGYDDAG